MEQLKPCPVCNSKAEFTEDFYGEGLFAAVYCPNIGCEIALVNISAAYRRNPAIIIESWNKLPRKAEEKDENPT